jgi:deoxyhypusine synthase
MSVASFMEENFKHFNARETLDAAKAWVTHTDRGDKMFLAMAGAMSTAEMGISLAKMIRAKKIHAISCTAANLEEDIFNAVSHNDYRIIPNYRELSVEEETRLRDSGLNRVTDTCIPETIMRHIDDRMVQYWGEASEKGESHFPVEYFYRLIEDGVVEKYAQIPLEHSWLLAAYEEKIPVFTPGCEDSTVGNFFASAVMSGRLKNHSAVKPGTAQMEHLARWYMKETEENSIGFFQIGGGIAGDFAICSVPMLIQDLPLAEKLVSETVREKRVKKNVKFWGYYCQISDSVTSYGSYSGAVPNEKITWWKLDPKCPKFMINSDATIVAPLIFQYVLEKSQKNIKNGQREHPGVRRNVAKKIFAH